MALNAAAAGAAAVSRWHEWTGNSLQTWQSQAAAVVVVVVKMLKQQKESGKNRWPRKSSWQRQKRWSIAHTAFFSSRYIFFSRQFGLRMCSNLAPLNDDEQEKKRDAVRQGKQKTEHKNSPTLTSGAPVEMFLTRRKGKKQKASAAAV